MGAQSDVSSNAPTACTTANPATHAARVLRSSSRIFLLEGPFSEVRAAFRARWDRRCPQGLRELKCVNDAGEAVQSWYDEFKGTESKSVIVQIDEAPFALQNFSELVISRCNNINMIRFGGSASSPSKDISSTVTENCLELV